MDTTPMFSGRIKTIPNKIINQAILKPQFEYELVHLFHFYILLEKANVRETFLLGMMSFNEAEKIAQILDQIDVNTLQADLAQNSSDISFAIECYVINALDKPIQVWHVDKSRNDFQACAQRMLGRQKILDSIYGCQRLCEAIMTLAEKSLNLPMPGYTHYQAAQIISPGFYLASINETLLSTLQRLLYVYDEVNYCPLGAGAMAGLELPWNRYRMAEQLGFTAPVRSALNSVADRDWTLKISFEYTLLSIMLSRFCTDLSMWGSSEYGFIDLPDELVSISSAMPQKKNFTILERIRGETAHLEALHIDFILGQRNTPYTNMVEVSKEAGRYLITIFQHFEHIVTLLTLVIEHLMFVPERMYEACSKDYFGGFALANALTLKNNIPYRTAQIIAGEFIRSSAEAHILPSHLEITTLQIIGNHYGYAISISQEQLHLLFDITTNLEGKQSSGSTSPQQVIKMLEEQRQEYEQIAAKWKERVHSLEHI